MCDRIKAQCTQMRADRDGNHRRTRILRTMHAMCDAQEPLPYAQKSISIISRLPQSETSRLKSFGVGDIVLV